MKKLSLSVFFLSALAAGHAQEKKPGLYHPEADAKADISDAIEQAGKTGKHVFLQIGGNWCAWRSTGWLLQTIPPSNARQCIPRSRKRTQCQGGA